MPACLPCCACPAGSERKAFNCDVRALVEGRFGRHPFDLALETKLYLLEKVWGWAWGGGGGGGY